MKKPRKPIRYSNETCEEFLDRGGKITKCPPRMAHDLLAWDTLPERILGATFEELDSPTSRWYLPNTAREAISEHQTTDSSFMDVDE